MKYIKENFKNRVPYHSKNITKGIILNANESPYITPIEVRNHISEFAKTACFNRYPDMDCIELRKAIAAFYDVDMDNVCCGVGSDELLDCIIRATVTDEFVLVCNPTFSMYKEFTLLGNGKVVETPLNDDFSYNVSNIIKNIFDYNPKVTFICTPNNPTGAMIDREDLIKIIETTKGLVVIDEAYSEFASTSFIDLALKYENVIVLKTFSKAYALAAMRVGYGISRKENIDMINIVKPPYDLSMVTQEAARFVISNAYLYKDVIETIKKDRDYLYDELRQLNIEIYPSSSNFLWTKLSSEIVKALDEKKIYVRKLYYKNELYCRINVGTKEENGELLKTIKGVIDNA